VAQTGSAYRLRKDSLTVKRLGGGSASGRRSGFAGAPKLRAFALISLSRMVLSGFGVRAIDMRQKL
jgi:hypothetical protein